MAATKTAVALSSPLEGFAHLPMGRQIGLMIGAAAAVALIVVALLWANEPGYRVLYGSLPDREAGRVLEALQGHGIPHQIDRSSGAVMVPAGQVHEARLKLAGQGLPSGGGIGYEMLQKESGFGTSQFMETARFQRALEGELARSISTVHSVESARVHLAAPRQSVFVRDRQKPTVSVVVNLYAGRTLDEGQVAAIVHLVASSVPELEPEGVTVIDQRGNLLTASRDERGGLARNTRQMDYVRRMEDVYTSRVLDILRPIVGVQGVRAQVVADVDFTVLEQTQESFNSEQPAIRSQQSVEESSREGALGGIPGALTNQPPGAGAAPEVQAQGPGAQGFNGGADADNGAQTPQRSTRRSTTNYELDRTISHTRRDGGLLRRVSVAVVVDDRAVQNAEGEWERVARTPEELERMTNLVREAVGFSEARGDSVNVVNAAFAEVVPEVLAAGSPAPSDPLWREPWVLDTAKQGLAILGVLLVVLFVLRPILRALATRPPPRRQRLVEGELQDDELALSAVRQAKLPQPPTQDYLATAQAVVAQDPKRVAQVVKTWLADEPAK